MTPIREVDLSLPLPELNDLGPHDRCMLVFRWRRRVVGRAFAPVVGGVIPAGVLAELVAGPPGQEALACWLDEHLEFDDRVVPGARTPSATVAICTRERPEDLRRTLEAVASLRGAEHEILVVDNAPDTDATSQIVERFPRVRYVREPRRGLNAARNRALREARGEVVAFTDDDAAPEPEWLEALLINFGDRHVACVTGLTLPLELETPAQELFEEHCSFARGFRRRVFDGECDNPLAVGRAGAGANMAVRRHAVLELGGFDERLDGGMPTRSGGDHELFVRILTAGSQIVYEPAAVSWHRHRRTLGELLDTVHGYGVGVYAMWTGLVLERREVGVLRLAWEWFRCDQLPALLGRGSANPQRARLARAELRGCLSGPKAWFAARRVHAKREQWAP